MTTPILTRMNTGIMITMLDDFIIRAALAGIGVSTVAGPLGSLVVWRRMAYFGDATAHAAILGVSLALAFQLPIALGTFVIALAMGALVTALMNRGHTGDATLAVLSHSALAFGLVTASMLAGVRVDLNAFLFGDILTTSWPEVALIWSVAAAILVVLATRWHGLIISTLNRELAVASGISPHREQAIFTVALALMVAISAKVIGALLIAAILVIPATSARALSRTPESMAIWASAIAGVSTIGGLGLSFIIDSPAGPSIIAVAAIIYAVAVTLPGAWKRRA